jgi:signal transduction histidine kinase
MALHHLTVFLFHRKAGFEYIYLIFALCCAATGVRFLIDQDSMLQYFSRSGLNTWFNSLYWFLSAAHLALYDVFSLAIMETRLSKRAYSAFFGAFCAVIVLFLVLPPVAGRLALSMLVVLQFILCVMTGRNLTLSRVRERPYLALYFLVLVLYSSLIPVSNMLAEAGLFAAAVLPNVFVILTQSLMLSQDYTEARRRARELAVREAFFHKMAHDMLTPLTIVSTGVQVAKMRPDKADGLLTRAQSEIMKIAEMVNEALEEAEGDGE